MAGEIEFRPYYLLTGNVDGALDKEVVANLSDLHASFVNTDGGFYPYSFDATATDAQASPRRIRPAVFTVGVHKLQSAWFENLTLEGGSAQLIEQSAAQTSAAGYGQLWVKDDTPNILKFTNDAGTDFDISLSGHTHTESEITDLQSYLLDISSSPLSELSDTTITSIASGEILKWNGSAWINNTLAEAGIGAAVHTHTESDITDLQSYYVPGGTDVAIADGGTGQSTAQLAINALSQVSGGTDEYVLTKDTATGDALWKVATGGGGGLGTNLTSTTNDITSDNDIVVLAGTSENMTLDFSGSNEVAIGSTTGVTNFNFTGTIELEDTTSSTTGVIYKGADRFIHNFGASGTTGLNLFIGELAGNFTLTGSSSGNQGSRNVCFGYESGVSLEIGNDNNFMGYRCGSSNTSGTRNNFMGYLTGNNNTTGSYNNFLGGYSGYSNTTGSNNCCVGYTSGYSITQGNNNNYIGYNAGRYIANGSTANTISDFCTLIGNETKVSTDGVQRETVIGYNAIGKGTDTAIIGAELTNTMVYLSGGMTTTESSGDSGVFQHDGTDLNVRWTTGDLNLVNDAGGSSSVVLEDTTSSTTGVVYKGSDRFIHNFSHPTGGGAVPDGRNFFIGVNSGNFTMGSTATSTFHSSQNTGLGGSTLSAVTTGNNNVGIGYASLNTLTTGTDCLAIGTNSLISNTTGLRNIGIGTAACFSTVIGRDNVGIGSSALYNSNVIFSGKNVGIGTFGLFANTTGVEHIGIGYNSGRYIANGSTANETSSYGVFLGAETKASADGVQRETVIGYNAIGKGTDTAIIGAEGTNERVYLTGGLTVNDEELDYDTNIGALNITNALFVQGSDGFVGVLNNAPQAPMQIGTGAISNSSDAQVLIARDVDDTISGNAHAFSDSSDITRGGGIGYNSFDARVNFEGTEDYDHYASFQFAPTYTSSGTMGAMYGIFSAPVVNSGTVTEMRCISLGNPTGAGTVTNYRAINIATPTKGTNSNYAIYSQGGNNYFGGNILIGNVGIGTNADGVIAITNGTAPTTSPNNVVQMWSEDLAAGDAALNLMTESDDIYKFGSYAVFPGNVGIGTATPTAKTHIDQSDSAGAIPVLKLDQGDIDDTFIDFIGTSAADGTRSISSDTTEDSAKFGAIRIEINGVTKWIRIYDDES